MKNSKNDEKSEEKKYDFLTEELSPKVSYSTYMISLILMKDFLFAPVIVFLVDYPAVEIWILITILTGIFIFTFLKKPFKSKLANFNLIVYSLLYIIILALFYYLEY